MARCPICKGEAKARAKNPSFPFCSPRCKTIDLGHWMSETYRVPGDGGDADDGDAGDGGGEEGASPSKRDVRN